MEAGMKGKKWMQKLNATILGPTPDIIMINWQPLTTSPNGSAKFFNNQSPQGSTIQAYDDSAARFMNELALDLDLTAALSS